MNDNHPWKRNVRKLIRCCSGCEPPKRHPGCGSTCKEYQEEKAKHNADKEREREYLKNHPIITIRDFNKG